MRFGEPVHRLSGVRCRQSRAIREAERQAEMRPMRHADVSSTTGVVDRRASASTDRPDADPATDRLLASLVRPLQIHGAAIRTRCDNARTSYAALEDRHRSVTGSGEPVFDPKRAHSAAPQRRQGNRANVRCDERAADRKLGGTIRVGIGCLRGDDELFSAFRYLSPDQH